MRASLWRFVRFEGGNFSVAAALSVMPLLAAIGLAVDYSRGLNAKDELQAAADSVVFAASANQNLTQSEFAEFTAKWVGSNVQQLDAAKVSASLQKTVGASYDNYLVNLNYPLDTTFMGLVGAKSVSISATANARVSKAGYAGACVIALDPVTSNSFYVTGHGRVSVPNCGIYVNSNSPTALTQAGAGQLTAKKIWVVGQATSTGVYTPVPAVNQTPLADPLATIPEPPIPSTCNYKNNAKISGTTTIPGGTSYCGNINVAANTNLTLGPGIHYFKGGNLSLGSNVTISGTGVMLFFDQFSSWWSAGTGAVHFTPMTSGTYKGIVIFGSRLTTTPKTFSFYGNKDFFMHGTIYLPKDIMQMYGTAELNVTAESGFVIAWRFLYQGDSSFTMDTFGSAVPDAFGEKKSATVALTK